MSSRQTLPPGAKRLESGRIKLIVNAPRGADGKRRQRSWVVDTVNEARKLYNEHHTAVETDSYIAPSTETLDAYLDGWLAAKRRSVKPATVESYVVALKHARRTLPNRSVQSLAKSDVERVIADILELGRSPRTANLTLTVLNAALKDAVKDGSIKSNPCANVKRTREVKPELDVWTAEELGTFLSAPSTVAHPWRIGLELAALGLRRSEVVGLRWCDVDLDARTISIRTTTVSVRGRSVASTPKSSRSRRTLPLDGVPAVVELLHTARLAAGLRVRRNTASTVLVDELGEPVRPERFCDELQRAMRDAGVEVIRPHDVRHTFATLALGAGIPVHEVAAWLGHDPAVCLRTYAHAIPSRLAGVGAAVRRAV
jgi:integrase